MLPERLCELERLRGRTWSYRGIPCKCRGKSAYQSLAQRILREDLGCRPYKYVVEPALTEEHKVKRKKFANWIRTNFRKQETLKILFSDEKMFDIDGVYNTQNDHIWVVSCDEANQKGGIHQKKKFPVKVMVWLGVCSKGVSPLVIFEQGTVDHDRYIKEVLPVALKYGNHIFDYW